MYILRIGFLTYEKVNEFSGGQSIGIRVFIAIVLFEVRNCKNCKWREYVPAVRNITSSGVAQTSSNGTLISSRFSASDSRAEEGSCGTGRFSSLFLKRWALAS